MHPKWYETHQNISLESNGVDRVRSLWKIPTRLRGTNFCTSSEHFALSFTRQPNGRKCTKTVRNTPKHEFRFQWGGSVAFVAKNSDATSWHELLHQFGLFRTEFCNATERCQMHKNSIKHYETWVLGSLGWMGTFVAKNSDTTSWHELLHHFGRFAPSFVRQPNGTKFTQIVLNAIKIWV